MLFSVFLDVVDETIGAGVMAASGSVYLQLWLDNLGKLFPQFNTTIKRGENEFNTTMGGRGGLIQNGYFLSHSHATAHHSE